jgi:Mg-chelatase subunit ChlD
MNASNAIVVGSIADVAKREGMSLAESFVNAEAIVLVDVSGSMMAQDSRGGQSRYDVALQELARLQRDMPGKIAVIAFSDGTLFVPGGQPPLLGESTNVAGALKFAKVADVPGMRFVLISDGQPNDQAAALNVAKGYKNRIDCVFVGPEDDHEGGRGFLDLLAKLSGGQSVTAAKAQELAAKTEQLLLSA